MCAVDSTYLARILLIFSESQMFVSYLNHESIYVLPTSIDLRLVLYNLLLEYNGNFLVFSTVNLFVCTSTFNSYTASNVSLVAFSSFSFLIFSKEILERLIKRRNLIVQKEKELKHILFDFLCEIMKHLSMILYLFVIMFHLVCETRANVQLI